MAMAMPMTVAVIMRNDLGRGLRVVHRKGIKCNKTALEHEHAAEQQHSRNAQRTQTLHLAETQGELVRRRLDAPGHRSKRQDVGCQIRQAVPGIGHHGL